MMNVNEYLGNFSNCVYSNVDWVKYYVWGWSYGEMHRLR